MKSENMELFTSVESSKDTDKACSQMKVQVLVDQLSLTLCDPTDCSLPGSSVRKISQVRMLDWVVISYSRRSPWPRNRTQESHTVGILFTIWATRGAQNCSSSY